MKQVSGKQLARAFERAGWSLARIQGSHHIYRKAGHRERLVIPIHANRPLKAGLLKSLMKISDLREIDLRRCD